MMSDVDRRSLPDENEVRKIYAFANKWFSRAAWKSFPVVQQRVQDSWDLLGPLTNLKIEDGHVNTVVETRVERLVVQRLLHYAFDAISTPWKVGPTPASKIIHGLFPRLAVMWDEDIRWEIANGETGYHYAYIFMPKMSNELDEAVASCIREMGDGKERAISRIKAARGRNYSLAKMIDEFNWVTIRRKKRLRPYEGQ